MVTIGDVIRDREPYFVRDTATALDAAEYMSARNIGAVCVLDEGGRLRGIFSERDLMRRVVLKQGDPAGVPIRDVMSGIDVVID
jgi:CBS domain-containing protein